MRLQLSTIVAVLGAALTLAACQPKSDNADFDARMKAYLLSHPDVLHAAIQKMQDKDDADQAKAQEAADTKAESLLPALRASLERDPRDFVANPNGKVTVTEFYDYRCPHCIEMAPRIVDLIRKDPNVRFVFKEMPIFGDASDRAALAAIAAKNQGKDYLGLYDAFMSAHPLTDDDVDRIATAKGVDLAVMNNPDEQAKAAAQLADVSKLAGKLNIIGTPGFVVGDTIIPGEDFDALQAAIVKAQGKA